MKRLQWGQCNNLKRQKEWNRGRATVHRVMAEEHAPALSLVGALFNSLACPLTSQTSVSAHGLANQLRFCAPASRAHRRARISPAHRCCARAEDCIQTPHCRAFIFISWIFFKFVSSARLISPLRDGEDVSTSFYKPNFPTSVPRRPEIPAGEPHEAALPPRWR